MFMDNFSTYGDTFKDYLTNLGKALKRCLDKHLTLNSDRCNFMVKRGTSLGHIISREGIEVDKEKVDLIAKLSLPLG